MGEGDGWNGLWLLLIESVGGNGFAGRECSRTDQ